MSTASVSGTVRPSTSMFARPPSAPAPEDAEAMREALAAARKQTEPEGRPVMLARNDAKATSGNQSKPTSSKPIPSKQDGTAALGQTGQPRARHDIDPLVAEREPARDGGIYRDGSGLAQQNVAPPVQIQAPPMPAPHVDAGAFAQLMTRLWNRESAKGTREVRVAFGNSTWPATGALLVRNAAGAVDIQLFTADREAIDGDLDDLRRRFADNDIAVGALEIREG